MRIHIIGTINGETNEGMRNIATHLSREFQKENMVLQSGLRELHKIIVNSIKADVTLIFARANQLTYYLSRLVTKLCRRTWIILVQKPDRQFSMLNASHPLACSYLSLTEGDLVDVSVLPGQEKRLFHVGIKKEKFVSVSLDKKKALRAKYGLESNKPLVIHVGHCSAGRGLEDFLYVNDVQKLVVASGMFESQEVVSALENDGVRIIRGYLENVEEIYQMADVYLFPTKSTEFVISIPLSVMEALSCGIPVIGYESFRNLQEIKGKKDAINLVNDPSEISDLVKRLLNNPSSKSLLSDSYTWDEVATQVMGILQGDEK